jgi:hypothetical protein
MSSVSTPSPGSAFTVILFYTLNKPLTPWSRKLLEKLTDPQLFPPNPKTHYRTHKGPPLPEPISPIRISYHCLYSQALHLWSQINSIHSLSHCLKIDFNIILLSTRRSFKWPLSFKFFHQNLVCLSLRPPPLPYVFMPRAFISSWFNHRNNMRSSRATLKVKAQIQEKVSRPWGE